MTILVFLHNLDFASRHLLDGIRRESGRLGWTLQTVEYDRDQVSGGYRFLRAQGGDSLPDLLEFWKPDGCIVESDNALRILGPGEFGTVPAVFINRPLAADGDIACVRCDNAAVASCAARELMLAGFRDYAYASCPEDPAWSVERGEAFRRVVERHGGRVSLFRFDDHAINTDSMTGALVPWLRSLPRPCGVFAANDRVGEGVLVACESLGLDVPGEVAVVGADNAEYICENTRPTLSSVAMDFFGAGRAAARALADALAGRTPAAIPSFGVAHFVRRASTLLVRNGDRRVRRALEFIRLRARDGITPQDVAREMGLSRRMADGVFRRAVGRTVFDEIVETRLARVRELVARNVPAAVASDMAGFGSLANMRRTFRKCVGVTIGAWAARNAQ